MSAQHTPGPWRYDPTWNIIHGPACEEIAAIHSAQSDNETRTKPEIAKANARLIAAAPELLEALQSLLALCEGGTSNALQRMDKARAAIAKAGGAR